MGEGFLPCRAAGDPRGWENLSLGSKGHPTSGSTEAKSAFVPASLARSAVQEVKQELKELGEHQEMTKATLEQLLTKSSEQMQEQVRSGGRKLQIGGRVLVGVSAVSPIWMGPSSFHSTQVRLPHPCPLRADSSVLSCSWTS